MRVMWNCGQFYGDDENSNGRQGREYKLEYILTIYFGNTRFLKNYVYVHLCWLQSIINSIMESSFKTKTKEKL